MRAFLLSCLVTGVSFLSLGLYDIITNSRPHGADPTLVLPYLLIASSVGLAVGGSYLGARLLRKWAARHLIATGDFLPLLVTPTTHSLLLAEELSASVDPSHFGDLHGAVEQALWDTAEKSWRAHQLEELDISTLPASMVDERDSALITARTLYASLDTSNVRLAETVKTAYAASCGAPAETVALLERR